MNIVKLKDNVLWVLNCLYFPIEIFLKLLFAGLWWGWQWRFSVAWILLVFFVWRFAGAQCMDDATPEPQWKTEMRAGAVWAAGE